MVHKLQKVSLHRVSREFARRYRNVGEELTKDMPTSCPPVRFEWAKDGKVNGYATAGPDGSASIEFYVVRMNEGLAVNVMALAVSVLAEPTTLSEEREYLRLDTSGYGCQGNLKAIRDLDWSSNLLLDRMKERNSHHVSLTSSRLEFARAAAQGAVFFAILHEMSHIRLGHFRWTRKEYGLPGMSAREKPEPIDSATFHALEIQADMMAASHFLHGGLDARSVHAVGFGVALLIHTIARVPEGLSAYNHLSHPHPLVRYMSLFGEEYVPESGVDTTAIHEAWRHGLWDASRALFDSGGEYMASGPLGVFSPRGDSGVASKIVMAAWKEAHRTLDRLVKHLKEYT